MEPIGSRLGANSAPGDVRTSYSNYPPKAEREYIKYIESLLESTSSQFRGLGTHVKIEYLKEKEKLVSILINPFSELARISKKSLFG